MLSRLKPWVKLTIVVGGYALALLLGVAAVAVNMARTNEVHQSASGGMTAFGDALLFLAVFVVAAIPPTVAALFFIVSWWRARRARR